MVDSLSCTTETNTILAGVFEYLGAVAGPEQHRTSSCPLEQRSPLREKPLGGLSYAFVGQIEPEWL